MVKPAREDVVITSQIRNILDNYPAGSATLREFLQNTDDSKATVQKFILDARTFSTDKLADPILERCQGPAIIAINNSHFLEKDWEAITQISDSSKTQDEASTGKYGLGFRSCYHITDNPHILSRNKLLILDPHKRAPAYCGGLELTTDDEDRQLFASHFQGFEAVFSSDVPNYDGTAIRLPLRLEHLAAESKIKSLPTTIDGARRMLYDFIAKELKESLLFLKHIERIELMEIDEDGNSTVMASVNIENIDQIRQQRSQDRGREKGATSFDLVVRIDIGATTENYTWFIQHFVEDHAAAAELMSQRLDGDAEEMATKMVADKLLPHVALAYPMETPPGTSQPFSGRLFTLLPLPIYTGFPAHINGVLALTSSRQNLRNAIDITPGSREEFLVKWNGLVLSKLAPHAWACLLEHITTYNGSSIWNAWPQVEGAFEGDRTYWFDLPGRLLDIAGARPVWPVRVEDDSAVYQNLGDVLVCEASDSTTPVTSISRYGPQVSVIADPVYAMIKRSKTFANRVLTPQSAYPILKANVLGWPPMTLEAAGLLSDYLSMAESLDLLLDLPIFPDAQQSYLALRSSGAERAILVTDEEAEILEGPKATFLRQDLLSGRTLDILLKAPANVASPLRPEDVVAFLQRLFGHFSSPDVSASAGVTVAHVQRLAAFWDWLGRWNEVYSSRLLDHSSTLWTDGMSKLHLLPLMTSDDDIRVLRKLDQSVIDPQELSNSPDLLLALQQFGVPLLHTSVRLAKPLASRLLKAPADITYILDQLSGIASFDHINQAARKELSRHFLRHLDDVQLSTRHSQVLRTLPIFPLLQPGSRSQNQNTFYGTAPLNQAYFVVEDVPVLPRLQGISLIDISESRPFYSALLGPGGITLLGEVPCLQLAISGDNWAQQAVDGVLRDLLVDRILCRLREFPQTFRDIIANLPIVEVGSSELKAPSSVVDPSEPIAKLYDQEDHVLPLGAFQADTPDSYLRQLRNFRMLLTELNEPLVRDMLQKLGDVSRTTSRRGEKALHLMRLLDCWTGISSASPSLIEALCSQAWLPVPDHFLGPSECWDSRPHDADLCDLVKPLLPYTVGTDALRRLLQWEEVPFPVIQQQFMSALADNGAPPIRKTERVLSILVELGNRFSSHRCSVDDIHALAEALGPRAWVPVSQDCCMPAARSVIDTGGAGARFYRVYEKLRISSVERLLLEMGIRARPTPDILLIELESMAQDAELPDITDSARDELFRVALLLINDILRNKVWFAANRHTLLLPTEEGKLKPIDCVIYNDRSFAAASPPSDLFFAHSSVSSALAAQLGLGRMSEEEFAEYEDEIDSFYFGEELHTRIQGVLKDYDVEYASNEWIANAHDAHAKNVVLTVDETIHGGHHLITDTLAQFQDVPALVIYNDGLFSDQDWKGLGLIGTGGKWDTPEAIGRFGLGALSFYHFTEVPMVVSGDSVLLLDPSQKFLPKSRSGQERSATKMPLKRFRAQYPDHLTPLHDLHGFDEHTTYYPGTLFRLPLRTSAQASNSLLSGTSFDAAEMIELVNRYSSLAEKSLFFSDVEKVYAQHRRKDWTVTPLWSVRVKAANQLEAGNGEANISEPLRISELVLDVHGPGRSSATEKWIVGRLSVKTDDFPEHIRATFTSNRIKNPDIGVAFEVTPGLPSQSDANSRLFATLPLPVSISLPVHLHAKWIMAKDRRSLRYDAPDARGIRPPDALYNEYLLKHLFPDLYLTVLEAISAFHPTEARRAWPSPTQDEISKVLTSVLYHQLPTTQLRVLRSVTDQLLKPCDAVLYLSLNPAIKRILTALHVENFVDSLPFNAAYIEKLEGLTRDTPAQINAILRSCQETVVTLFQAHQVDDTDLDSLLKYLLGGEVDLSGLPLLRRGDDIMTTFNAESSSNVFDVKSPLVPELFGRDKILGPGISKARAAELQKHGWNVKSSLDSEGLRELLKDCTYQIVPASQRDSEPGYLDYVNKLLKLLGSSPELPLADFEDLPLIPAKQGDSELFLSIRRAKQEDVWWRSRSTDDSALDQVLELSGFLFVNSSATLISAPHSVTVEHLLTVIDSLSSRLADAFATIPPPVWVPFAAWIKNRLQLASVASMKPQVVQTLMSLPLFEAYRGNERLAFTPANRIVMLPRNLGNGESVRRWLPIDTIYAPFDGELHRIIAYHSQNRIMDVPNIVEQLQLPEILSQQEDEHYREVMSLIAGSGDDRAKLLYFVPDQQRRLRQPSDLYNHQEPLFLSCLGNRRHLFVHDAFRQDMTSLRRLGVRHGRPLFHSAQSLIQPADLLACIRAVDEDARRGLDGTRDRAIHLWEYMNDLGIEAARNIQFQTIANLRFIPAHPRRHLSSHDLEAFALPKPDVVTPMEVYLDEHAHVLWTQRVRFRQEPSRLLRAVYQELGVPSALDVVNHLERLAISAATSIPQQNATVLYADVKKTYSWLRQNEQEAATLLLGRSNRALWLNVDDPKTDPWVWRNATQLVFDLHHDNTTDAGRFFNVRTFLMPYKDLLLSAGAKEYHHPQLLASRSSAPQAPHSERLRTALNQLREQDALLDVYFVVNNERIPAHRTALAAMIPHFLTAFTGSFRESQSFQDGILEYPVQTTTSVFAVRSVVDYTYTGTFIPPTLQDNEDRAEQVLEDLLELMGLADCWEIIDLRAEAVKAIVDLRLVRVEFCDDIRTRAEQCNEPDLVKVCDQAMQQNPWAA